MTSSDETFLLDRQFRQMTLGAGLDVYNDTTLFSNIAIGEPLDNGTVGGVEIATAIGNAGGALVVNAGAIIGNPLNIPSVGTSVALSSDFSFSSGTLVAQSSIARTSQTLQLTNTGTIAQYVTGPVDFQNFVAATAGFGRSVGTIAATGSTQATATVATAQDTTVTSGSGGVQLTYFGVGAEQVIRNRTTLTFNVYPQSGSQIETAGTNVAVTLGAGQDGRYCPYSATQWRF